MTAFNPPVLLAANHQLDGFRCRSPEQTNWLVAMARQAHGSGTTRVFVVSEVDQPVALLARLGVDQRYEGQGLGAALLADVISRVAGLSDAIGCRGLLVHAESEQARAFYEHLIPEWELSPTDPMHLVLLLKDIRHTLNSLR